MSELTIVIDDELDRVIDLTLPTYLTKQKYVEQLVEGALIDFVSHCVKHCGPYYIKREEVAILDKRCKRLVLESLAEIDASVKH